MNIGDRLKRLRKELDLTQEAFASRIGSVQNQSLDMKAGGAILQLQSFLLFVENLM